MITNTKAYYNLTNKRNEVESKLEELNNKIKSIREEAKKLPKGSDERMYQIFLADEIKKSEIYKLLYKEFSTLNYCINTVFYS